MRPFADLRRLEFVQVLTAAPNGNRGAHAMIDARQLWPRLALLGLGTVIVQIAAISQLRVFDTNADLTPLVVADGGAALRLAAGRRRSASASGCSSTSRSCRPSACPRCST